MSTLQEDAEREIRSLLCQGFAGIDEIEEEVIEILNDEHKPELVSRAVKETIPIILRERESAMKSWPEVTDCDRLDAAFEELNSKGIMARHHWTCCSNCGRAEMPHEFDRLDGEWDGVPIIGYTFYHIQDTERAVEGEGIYLGYGSCEGADSEEEYEKQSLTIAQTVRDVLEAHGLVVSWNGTYDKKIKLMLQWQRRRRPLRFCEGDTQS